MKWIKSTDSKPDLGMDTIIKYNENRKEIVFWTAGLIEKVATSKVEFLWIELPNENDQYLNTDPVHDDTNYAKFANQHNPEHPDYIEAHKCIRCGSDEIATITNADLEKKAREYDESQRLEELGEDGLAKPENSTKDDFDAAEQFKDNHGFSKNTMDNINSTDQEDTDGKD